MDDLALLEEGLQIATQRGVFPMADVVRLYEALNRLKEVLAEKEK